MGSQKNTVPFAGTKEQEAALLKVIAEHKDDKGALMPIMQKAQDIYGYLPIEVQSIISNEMNVPLEKIYGIATFYSQFSLSPKGKYKVSVCLGTACYVKGSGDIFSKVQEMLALVTASAPPTGNIRLNPAAV
jgi:NADP-reducing hydrogenase subunit HndA